MLEQRDVQVSQSWQGREEKLKLHLSRGIPRRFRPSLRILTTPNLETLASTQCVVGLRNREHPENALVVREPIPACIFRIPRDRQYVTRYFAERSFD